MHWAEVAELDFAGQPVTAECAAQIKRLETAVEIAQGYIRECKFLTLLAELPGDILEGAARAADWLRHGDDCHECFPLIAALTVAGWSLGHREETPPWLDEGKAEAERNRLLGESMGRVGLFVLCEAMRRREVWTKLSMPFDPWDDATHIVSEGMNNERLSEFTRWLGYDD